MSAQVEEVVVETDTLDTQDFSPDAGDDAFGRRFQAKIMFDVLGDDQRLELWQQLLTRELKLGPDVNLMHLNKLHRLNRLG